MTELIIFGVIGVVYAVVAVRIINEVFDEVCNDENWKS